MPRKYNKGGKKKNNKGGGRKKMIPKALMPHFFLRTVSQAHEALDSFDFSVNPSLTQMFKGYSTYLNQTDGVTELNSLFDSYRITAVKWELFWNQGDNASISSASGPMISYFFDRDDDNAPTDSEMRQRSTKRSFKLSPHKLYTIVDRTPKVASSVYESGLATGYSQVTSPRLDMADKDVPHFGLKVQVDKPPINIGYLRVRRTVYVTCYGTR